VKLPPGHRLSYDVVEYGKASPRLGKLCNDIESWTAKLAVDDPAVIPIRVFEAGDWKIELTLIGGFRKDVDVNHAIGSAMGDIRA
jgi:hypothetical protein